MVLFGHFLDAFAMLLNSVIVVFLIACFGRFICSWVNADPGNMLVQFLYGITDPLLRPIQKRIPPIGYIDLSLLVLTLALIFVDRFFVGYLSNQAVRLMNFPAVPLPF